MPELYRVDADWQDWLSEIWDEVDSIASESRLRQAVVRATNDTLTHMRSFLSKGIRATYYVKKADIDAAMQIVKARQRGRKATSVRTLECCSGDLADLKVKSCDVEAWSPRQKKYFEVGSCSTLGDAQARRLGIRTKGENGTYFVHTLNNTVLATPRGLIAFLENNVNEDGTVNIPEALRPYMGGVSKIG